ncbi:Na(+)-translocating NADH-quinone reductase subunit A [Ponticoccus sp. SC2-23]|nr:Na(+)-translocating NADH-quinone reductase subunit A [Ponticoccus sp. SC6-9]MBM1223941.1 Na(+)-translocating NADH-quinone reductase subunit A [Ponticoccus sp. SC6-15]MBM1230280.1 Na(+)-translocating NADH-quinone reductase subunit A [Ponticoccus sp. SC6-38]MBM1232907.1 Na(+)-translocating NADH-quinone reductase subunit A [Ponticoccus sp. SC6-45]MBM1237143.1 Na(+)-translocating NADH-quinone reductase subunit A [Ponticoccus sp. SC6-49]MBM1241918.1 Na(+)-translocating NADH-quinone reductase sub
MGSAIDEVVTEEAGVRPPRGASLHVTPLVSEGEVVAKGAALACLRHAPDICFAAPIAGRVARLDLLPGRKLSEIVLFRENEDAVEHHDTSRAGTAAGVRHLMQVAGFWPRIRRRPFGGMPSQSEQPSAIIVMAIDTRPFAPDPRRAIKGQAEVFDRGLAALAELTDGPVHVICAEDDPVRIAPGLGGGRVRVARCGRRHPQGSAGIRIHDLCPAALDTPVWDLGAEDVAALGALVESGELPMTRLVNIAGAALREARIVRTHPGADLRQLTQRYVERGPHVLMSGSPLDGHMAHWLAPRHRQITVLPREAVPDKPHWLIAALTRASRANPVIPTAALDQALAAAMPAIPFIRALSASDDETAMKLGVLSLLEEDLALADYVLSQSGQLTADLRGMLDRIETEYAA